MDLTNLPEPEKVMCLVCGAWLVDEGGGRMFTSQPPEEIKVYICDRCIAIGRQRGRILSS